MNNIHFIGDSHTWIFLERLPDSVDSGEDKRDINNIKYNDSTLYCYRCCGSDGALAYTIEKRIDPINKFLSRVSKEDYICFMFGESDCRWKIFSYSQKKNITIEEETKKVVKKYTDFIKNEWSDYKIILWGPHAQYSNPSHPYFDSDMITRNKITKIFNEELKKICKNNNWKFISIFDEMIDEDLKTNDKYFLNDTIHMIPEKCKEKLLNQIFSKI